MTAGPYSARPHRVERLRRWLADQSLDCAVVAGAEQVNHLVGYWRYFGSPGALVLTAAGELSLVVVYDEAPEAARMLPAVAVHSYGDRGFGLDPDPVPKLLDVVASLPEVRAAGRRIAVAADREVRDRIDDRIGGSSVDCAPVLASIRLVKDGDEIAKVARAYQLALTAQAAVRDACHAGVSEIELFTIGQAAAQNQAGEPIQFFGDLLAGSRASEVCAPVMVAGRTRLGDGDAIVSDLVAGCRGYWGDTAETVIAGANPEVEAARETLLAILEDSAAALVPGRTAESVFAAMHTQITAELPAGEFPHHGGHGLGSTPYERPHVIPGDRTVLEAGMIIALEPGVYFRGRFGVRVERTYLVEPQGGQELARLELGGNPEEEHADVEH